MPAPDTTQIQDVTPEPMPVPELTSGCDIGTELVDGMCKPIPQEQDSVLDMIKGWFESLFSAFF